MLFLISMIIFAAVALSVWSLLQRKDPSVALRAQLPSRKESPRDMTPEGSLSQRLFAPLARRVGGFLARLVPQDAIRRMDRMLVMAGESATPTVFLGIWAGSVIFGAFILLYINVIFPDITTAKMLFVGLPILLLTVGSPYLVLRAKVRDRQNKIIRALPDALDLIITCMEAGLGVDAAFAKVAEKTSGPLAETISLYLRQVGMGRPRRDALTYVAERTGARDLIRLAAAVTQAELVGASLGDALRMQAGDIRVARRRRAEQAARRAPVLMTIPLVTCFVPAMGIIVVVPSLINLMSLVQL